METEHAFPQDLIWKHEPETDQYAESWSGWQRTDLAPPIVTARVNTIHAGMYEAHIYPDGKHRKVGDVYKSSGGAKNACKRALAEALEAKIKTQMRASLTNR